MSKTPFSDDTAILVLDKLKDQEFVQSLVNDLRKVFKVRLKLEILGVNSSSSIIYGKSCRLEL